MKTRLVSKTFIALSLLILANVQAIEEQQLAPDNDPLPHSRGLSRTELEKTCQLVESVPYENPELAFHVILPADWKASQLISPIKESERALVPIGLYAPPGAAKATVAVQLAFFRLEYDINVRDWLGWYATSTGIDAKSFRNYPNAKVPAWDMLAADTRDGVELLTRISAFQAGSRIFVAACTCPAAEYDTYKMQFARACDTFELKKSPDEALAQKLSSVEAESGHRLVTLRFPESWKSTPKETQLQGAQAWQLSLNIPLEKKPDAPMETASAMFVKLIDRAPFERIQARDLYDISLSELKTAGFEPGTEAHSERVSLANFSGNAEIHYLPVKQADRESEAAIAVIDMGTSILTVTSVRPAIQRNPWTWMVGKRALEILLNYSNVARSRN